MSIKKATFNMNNDSGALKLLSLDGGGIRGLSSLIILKYLMKRINPDDPPKPWQYFDLIGGTSTGGLIAIMLGRFRMDIDECIKKYLDLSSAAFQPKRSQLNVVSKTKDLFMGKGRYQEDRLEQEFKTAAELFEGDEDAKLLDSSNLCRVFVCTFEKNMNLPTLLRSYITKDTIDPTPLPTIWQAARATSAATSFFDPVVIGGHSYVDGATGMNNPIEAVIEEAKSIWSDALPRIQCLVSVGTGVPEQKDFGDDIADILKTLKIIATDTQKTHERFFRIHRDLGLEGRYFRFNVPIGLQDIRLDDHKKVAEIEVATRSYLSAPDTQATATLLSLSTPPNDRYITKEEKDKYLAWLPYSNNDVHYNNIRQARTTNVGGDWFMEGSFNKWVTQESSLLWLHAKAGSGKSVLISTIIDKIQDQELGTLAYYFFSFQDRETQTLQDFKTSILIQLVKCIVQKHGVRKDKFYYIPQSFYELYESCYPSKHPKTEDLSNTILALLNESNSSFVVVDALDECHNVQLRYQILNFMAWVMQEVTTNVRILIASRPEVDIKQAICELPISKSTVPFATKQIDEDIHEHLTTLMELEPYSNWSKSLKSEVVNVLSRQADGVFRWADLHIQQLAGKRREIDIRRALKILPSGLSATYKRMLEEIVRKNQQPEALAILRWLAWSRRPLTLIEVAEIVGFTEEVESNTELKPMRMELSFNPEYKFGKPAEAIEVLSNLVTVTYEFDKFAQTTIEMVSFSHFSVKEYLESSLVFPPQFHLEEQDCHWFILRSCVAYICHYDNTTNPTSRASEAQLNSYPLLPYSCLSLWSHSEKLLRDSKGDTESTLVKLINPLMHKPQYASILALARGGYQFPSRFLTAEIIDFFQQLEDQGAVPRLRLQYYRLSAFFGAALSGYLSFLQFLMDSGLNVPTDPSDDEFERDRIWSMQSLLHLLIMGSSPKVSELFHKHTHPAKSNFDRYELTKELILSTYTDKHAESWTDLELSPSRVKQDRFVVVNRLLEAGMAISMRNRYMQTPFLYACLKGDDAMVDFLLTRQADCTEKDCHGWGALTCAIIGGNKNVVKSILACDQLDIYTPDQYGWAPFEWALYLGNNEIIDIIPAIKPLLEKQRTIENGFIVFNTIQKFNVRIAGIDEVWCVKFSNNGKLLAACGPKGVVIIDLILEKSICHLSFDYTVFSVTWSPDDSMIVTSSWIGRCEIFDIMGSFIMEIVDPDLEKFVNCVWDVTSESFILGFTNGVQSRMIHVFPSTAEYRRRDPVPHFWECIASSPDRERLYIANRMKDVDVYSAVTRQLVYTLRVKTRSVTASIINISVGQDSFLVNMSDGTMHLYSTATGDLLRVYSNTIQEGEFKIEANIGGVKDAFVVRGTHDGFICVWEKDTGRFLGHIDGHVPSLTNTVAWNGNDPYMFASGGDDGIVKIWSCKDSRIKNSKYEELVQQHRESKSEKTEEKVM